MVLDYERFQIKSKRKKSRRVIFVILFGITLLVGSYFIISNVILKRPLFDYLFSVAPVEEIDSIWNRFVTGTNGAQGDDVIQEGSSVILDEIIIRAESLLKENPLDLRALVFHGFAVYYRSGFENTFETRLPYYNLAVASLRRAMLVAPREMKPQLSYMLGKTYFFKREYYYDLAAKYLETALNLGYKEPDTYEFLVLINETWGNTETSIRFLEQAREEKKSDVYLFYLARAYKKVARIDEAKKLLAGLLEAAGEPALTRECKFLLGEIYFDQGDVAAAEQLYRQLLETDNTSAEAHFRLALILEKKGDYAGYRFELRRTLENDPGHSGARSRL